jgi:hypothetical protein
MKRYYNDDPEPEDFFEGEGGDEESPSHMIYEESEILGGWQLNVLAVAINFLSQNFFWRFKNYKTKLKETLEVYDAFYESTKPKKENEDASL